MGFTTTRCRVVLARESAKARSREDALETRFVLWGDLCSPINRSEEAPHTGGEAREESLGGGGPHEETITELQRPGQRTSRRSRKLGRGGVGLGLCATRQRTGTTEAHVAKGWALQPHSPNLDDLSLLIMDNKSDFYFHGTKGSGKAGRKELPAAIKGAAYAAEEQESGSEHPRPGLAQSTR